MSFIVDEVKSEYQLPQAKMQLGVCYQIVDIGTQKVSAKFEPTRRVMLFWELPGDLTKDGKPLSIRKEYTLNPFNEKAGLHKDLQSWLGYAPKAPFDMEAAILGKPCNLNIIHNVDGEKTYANIANIVPLMDGQKTAFATNPQVCLSLHPQQFNKAVFDDLPEWLQDKIKTSPEFERLINPQAQKSASMGDVGGDTREVPVDAYEYRG